MIAEMFDGVTAPALPLNWSQSTTASNAWITVAGSGSDTAPNHAFVADLPSVSDSRLTSPSFVVPAATPRLNFRNFYNTETNWDGGVLEIAINGGAFSDILTAGGSFVSGGYVGTLNSSGNPLANRPAWHGNSGGYISTVVNLPGAAIDQSVVLRWRMGSDESENSTGWRIDTIFLDGVPTTDFGDAPSSYPISLAQNGARHTVGALFLGGTVDTESDGVASLESNSEGSDDDGVTFNESFSAGSSTNIEVIASAAGGLLSAWFDWNQDGDWSDANEQVFANVAISSGANALAVPVPSGTISGHTYARFRLSTDSGLGVTGLASNGEVEDYRVNVDTTGSWFPLGPFSATNGQVENIASRPVVGAVHAVLAHPVDPDILYVGSTNGGVWKTVNATAVQPHWVPLTDAFPSQSIGALAFDVGDTSNNTVYAGNARYSSFGRIGNQRNGLMRTVNGGDDWDVVDGGGLLVGKNVSGIIANGNTIVVSVNVADNYTYSNIGIFRSTNGGANFTRISNGNGAATGLPGGVAYDLVADPLDPNTLYTSTVFSDGVGGVNGVYKSIDAGASWAKVSIPAMDALITNNTSNIEMAAGHNNEVYAAFINAGAFAGLFRSPDNGITWVQMDSPKTNENGDDVGLNPSGGKGPSSGAPEEIAGGQGSIHFSIAADPNNANIVYVGGDRQPRSFGDTGGFPNSIGATDFSGRLFRGDASQPAGSQFVHLTHRNDLGAVGGGTASSSSPHADSRDMAIDANGHLIEVDDGGVYRRTSPTTNMGDWYSVIGDLQVTEAHDVAWDSLSNVAMTGNQDTGSTYQPFENAIQWVSVSTADGGDIAIDNIELAGSDRSVRYSSFQNLGGFRRTVWNATGGLVSTTFPSLTPTSGSSAIAGAFRTRIATNTVAGGRLLIQGANSLYESMNGGNSVTAIGVGLGNTNLVGGALWYGGTKDSVVNPDLVWAASGSDVYLRTAGTGAVSATASDPTGESILGLAVNPDDWSTSVVIDGNNVFLTSNSGDAWSDITGNLMTFAAELRSVAFVTGAATGSILVGTNIGVFAAATSALGSWVQVGSGLPNIQVFDMDYDPVDDVLVVGTLGRGAWKIGQIRELLAENQAPTDITLGTPFTIENSPSNSIVDSFNTEDPDSGDTFEYQLVAGSGDTDNARFTLDVNGVLRVNEVFDFETMSSYSIRVQSTDSGGLSLEKTFTISVLDSPELIDEPVLGDGTDQHSLIDRITLTFDDVVVVEEGAFELLLRGGAGGVVPTTFVSQTNGLGQTEIVLSFSGSFTRGASGALIDGYYQLSIDGTKIRRNDLALDVDQDGVGGDALVIGDDEADDYFALFGDTNGDGIVSLSEFNQFRSSFGKAPSMPGYDARFDFDGGGVTISDFNQFRSRFGRPRMPWE